MFKQSRVIPLLIAAVACGGLAAPQALAQPTANPVPAVVPAPQQWHGGIGSLRLGGTTRIVTADAALRPVATRLRADLAEIAGLRPRITDSGPRARDIVVTLDPDADVGPGAVAEREGYRLDVAGDVRITARTATGAFWGTRTLLQMLAERNPDPTTLPVGTVVDWPNVAVRGFMLDIGRRWFEPEFLRDYIRYLSWFKLNTFQIHLNDNQIQPPGGDWSKAQSAFRLASDNPRWAGLAAADGALTRADWSALEDVAAAHAVTLVPEIDAPAHARAFIEFQPSLGLNGGNSDHLDLSKPETTAFMKELYAEFAPWFRSPYLHIGLDEYPRELEPDYRRYTNEMAAHVRSLGKTVRAWGSLSVMAGGADGYDRGMEMVSWNNSWYGGKSAIDDGYQVINARDASLYIVPFAGYYHGRGLDGRWLYDNWEPHVFGGGQDVAKGDPRLLGAMSAVWNDLVDLDYGGPEVHGLVEPTFGLLGHKMWRGPVEGMTYERFMADVGRLGVGPGVEGLTSGLFDEDDRALPVRLSAPAVSGSGESVVVTATATNTGATRVARPAATLRAGGDPIPGRGPRGAIEPGASATWTWTLTLPEGGAQLTASVSGVRRGADTTASARRSVAVVPPAPDGTRHLSFSAVATASSVEAGLDRLAARHVNDGSLTTRWSSAYRDGEWVQLTLAAPARVSSVRLHWEPACARAFTIQTSVDGTTWTDAATVPASSCRVDDVPLSTTGPVRHIRMQGVSRATTYGYSLYELWAFGTPA